ncbi:SgrR family transcriptional regulator [Hazenella sp. IB182357]|uniref:SgrR family transcriptional regulator n=1 Tax=Polycladospora coralii TaxID=2771432 RepID=A0A926RUB6_9BACL|nr:SgrR family transcriptional regulator [Polycladospora coralii]MBD1372763.1 SgrR family transcriptional regulator [Polycladospora coralii]MBS7531155.1 SgrR family transcriptional regulator [Polycladospora coralii]
MRIIEHYLVMYASFLQKTEGDRFETTLDEISEKLNCSKNNTKIVLRSLKQEDWIEWHSQRGRGKRSIITFKVNIVNSVKTYISEQLEKGNFIEGSNFLKSLPLEKEMNEVIIHYIETGYCPKKENKEECLYS